MTPGHVAAWLFIAAGGYFLGYRGLRPFVFAGFQGEEMREYIAPLFPLQHLTERLRDGAAFAAMIWPIYYLVCGTIFVGCFFINMFSPWKEPSFEPERPPAPDDDFELDFVDDLVDY